jgi:DNA-binding SARP family transcriptional activator
VTSDQERPIQIQLLGSFEVRRGDRVIRVDDWLWKKSAALLKRLALERWLLKDQAIEFLWPEADPASAANNLYKTLHDLRRVLNTTLGFSASVATFHFEDGVLNLAPAVWVDVQEFERLCTIPSTAPAEQRKANLEQALVLYQGDLLPDDRYNLGGGMRAIFAFRVEGPGGRLIRGRLAEFSRFVGGCG